MRSNPQKLLEKAFPTKHVGAFLLYFAGTVKDFRRGEWGDCIAKAGKFIEAVLKALYVSANHTLPSGRGFKADTLINALAQMAAGSHPDSVRLTIPRACRFVYDIASNRGGRHDPDEVDPNEMDANAVVTNCSWILAEMIRIATKGATDLGEAERLVDSLTEKKYPLFEEVDGRMYFHLQNKSAPDVALLALAKRYPERIGREELIRTITQNSFTEANARVAINRIMRFVDDNGREEFRLLATGLQKAEKILRGRSQ